MHVRNNVTPFIDYSDSDDSNVETFISGDAHQRFIDYLARMSVHSEKGFIYNMDWVNMGVHGDIRRIIKTLKLTKFYRHPNSYNVQMVKEFYTNLVDTSNKINEVMVRGTKVVYSEETINMAMGLHNVGDTYQHLLETADD